MIVGRSAERERLEQCVHDALDGSGSALVLCADAGVGKSALLHHTAHHARERGLAVITIEGVRGEEELAWAGVSQMVAHLRHHLDDLAPHHREALDRVTGATTGGAPTVHAVYVAVLALVAESASPSLLIVVDDLHWLDRETAGALVFLARRLVGVPASMVLATRDLVDLDLPDVVRMNALDEESCTRIVAAASAVPVDPQVVQRLLAAADGNPLALLALVASLPDRQLGGEEPLPDPLPLAPGLDALLSTRIEALPEPTRDALATAAMSGVAALPVDDVVAVARVTTDDLVPAEASGIVTLESGRVRFTHPLHRSAAYWSHPAHRRRELHLRFAELETDPARSALHHDDATPIADPSLGTRLEGLALAATADHNHTTAVSLMVRAERHADDSTTRQRLALSIARSAIALGNIALARTRALSVDHSFSPSEVHSVRAAIAEHDGDLDEAIRLWRLAVAATEEPNVAADILISGSVALIRRGEFVAVSMLIGDTGLDPAVLDRRRSASLDVLAGLAQLATSQVTSAAIARTARYDELVADDDAIVDSLDLVSEVVAPGLAMTRQYDAALDLARRVEALAIARHNPRVMPSVETTRGMVAYRRNYAAASGHFEEAVSLADALGQPTLATGARTHLAVILGQLGRSETLDLAANLTASPIISDRVSGHMALGIYWLTLGVPERAVDALLPLHQDHTIDPARVVLRWQADLAEAATRCGDTRLAEEVADQLRLLAASGEHWLVGAHARVRGMLADIDRCGVHFAASAAAMEAAVNTSGLARAELLWGERLRRARRRAEARPHLERARDLFRDLACGRWVERAELELVAAGAATGTTDHTRDPDRVLTPHELHVARLAVAGATYRDIAAQLFVSPRTVEGHLSSIYRKLGVKNRAGLAALAAAEPALQPVD